ncbi:MAG: glycine cleavage system protein H [candidate division Zixibacteria bacterium SM23_73_2]|nr:MAG: glycine cleavage system protein H [candidate division Zixibacteria bacterium SM23_73_2]
MEIREDLKYTREHEWIKIEGEQVIMGITDYAQGELGDVVFVELPKIGNKVEQFKPLGTIEAVKAVSDLFAPLSGEVVEVNTRIETEPSIINQDPYGEGWIVKIKPENTKELDSLLSKEEYEKLLEQH